MTPEEPPAEPIARAAAILRAGGLVAFPTETVYGLGADALNPRALARVYAAKRRPTEHPLIVHVADASALDQLALRVPDHARRLAQRFWPGPLTLVLERHPRVPREVTGGQDTIAIRVPAHPLALALLREFGGPIAAPSANRFGAVSPTTAAHVRDDLGADVDLILDGGACEVGLESTIVDLTRSPATVLRLGGISEESLSEALGEPVLAGARAELRVPGSLASHYAPVAEVVLVTAEELGTSVREAAKQTAKLAVLLPEGVEVPDAVTAKVLARDPAGYAHELYASLRELDAAGASLVLVVPPEALGVGRAVLDRLERAAAPRDEPQKR
jgi:L-threonylcarbamoyladenylate synthase